MNNPDVWAVVSAIIVNTIHRANTVRPVSHSSIVIRKRIFRVPMFADVSKIIVYVYSVPNESNNHFHLQHATATPRALSTKVFAIQSATLRVASKLAYAIANRMYAVANAMCAKKATGTWMRTVRRAVNCACAIFWVHAIIQAATCTPANVLAKIWSPAKIVINVCLRLMACQKAMTVARIAIVILAVRWTTIAMWLRGNVVAVHTWLVARVERLSKITTYQVCIISTRPKIRKSPTACRARAMA